MESRMTNQLWLGPSARYVCWTLIAIAYGVAFLQRMAPLTMVDQLLADLGMSAAGFSTLVAAYFVGYTAMQFPAGVLVDVFGVRAVILSSLAISLAGTFGFSLAADVVSASFYRVIVAAGDALVFSCLLKFSASSFSNSKFGLISGMSQVAGYVGGIVATVPLAIAAKTVGWRGCSAGIATLLLSCFVLLFIFLPRDTGAVPLRARIAGTLRNR